MVYYVLSFIGGFIVSGLIRFVKNYEKRAKKYGEEIIINENITLTVIENQGGCVKLGFVFPKTASVLRKELYDKTKANGTVADLYMKGLLT